MGMMDIGANLPTFLTKIGDTVNTVLETASPLIDLVQKGKALEQSLKSKGKPKRSNSDATIVPGQIPTQQQLDGTPPKAMSQTGGNGPMIAIAAGVVLLFLLKK